MDHITVKRMCDIKYNGEQPTPEDMATMFETISAYWRLTANMAELKGYVTLLDRNDNEIELSEAGLSDELSNLAEKQEDARNEAYYGGEGP